LVGLLGWDIGPSQGLYLHRADHRKTCTYIQALSGIRTQDLSVQAVQDRLMYTLY